MRLRKSLVTLGLLLALPAVAQAHSERLNYSIQHQLWGEIGTLTEEISSDGTVTNVTAKLDVHVAVLGITLNDTHGRWNEVWQDGQLQLFDATTLANGKIEKTTGQKDGAVFVIRSGDKRIEAPADVRPVNPWSLQFVRTSTLMSPETGRLIPAVVHDEGLTSVKLPGASMPVHHYVVEADGEHELYFDNAGMLVRSEFADLTGKVTVTLTGTRGLIVAEAR